MLTHKQKNMLTELIKHFERHDVPPSFEELCAMLDLKSKSGVHRLLTGLEERGYIRRLANRARAIEVLKKPDGTPLKGVGNPIMMDGAGPDSNADASVSVPILGRIAAGSPIEAISHQDGTIDMPQSMMGGGEHYALKIEGDSMIGEGIMDGDTVLIERCETAPNNTIVVALIDGEEATLKKMHRKGDSIALEAANPDYETRIFGPDRVVIQGKLAGLFRSY